MSCCRTTPNSFPRSAPTVQDSGKSPGRADTQTMVTSSVHSGLHYRGWLPSCCFVMTALFFLASTGRESNATVTSPGECPGRESHGRLCLQHDPLGDVSNATLGVRSSPLQQSTLFAHTSQFQKIFVIGLPSRTDRRDSMSLAAAYAGLEIEYFDGVTAVENITLPPGGVERGLDSGSIGVWRTHMNVMR